MYSKLQDKKRESGTGSLRRAACADLKSGKKRWERGCGGYATSVGKSFISGKC